jgi:hypothetical protein
MKAPPREERKTNPEYSVKVLLKPISRSTMPPRRPNQEAWRRWLSSCLRRVVPWTGRWE